MFRAQDEASDFWNLWLSETQQSSFMPGRERLFCFVRLYVSRVNHLRALLRLDSVDQSASGLSFLCFSLNTTSLVLCKDARRFSDFAMSRDTLFGPLVTICANSLLYAQRKIFRMKKLFLILMNKRTVPFRKGKAAFSKRANRSWSKLNDCNLFNSC
jgi:hypothetical protein